jgi:hypothetical protein
MRAVATSIAALRAQVEGPTSKGVVVILRRRPAVF